MIKNLIKNFLLKTYLLRSSLKLTATKNKYIFFIKEYIAHKSNNKNFKKIAFEIDTPVCLDLDRHNPNYNEIIEILKSLNVKYFSNQEKNNSNQDINCQLLVTDKFSLNLYKKTCTLFLFDQNDYFRDIIIKARVYSDYIFFNSPFKKKFYRDFFKHINLIEGNHSFQTNHEKLSQKDDHKIITIFLDERNLSNEFKQKYLDSLNEITQSFIKKKVKINFISNTSKIKLNNCESFCLYKLNEMKISELKNQINNTNYLIFLNISSIYLKFLNEVNLTTCKIIHPNHNFYKFIPPELSVPLDLNVVKKEKNKFCLSKYTLNLLNLEIFLKINFNNVKPNNFVFNKKQNPKSLSFKKNLIYILLKQGILKNKDNFIPDKFRDSGNIRSNIELYLSTSNRFEFFDKTLKNIFKAIDASKHNINLNIFVDNLLDKRYINLISEYKLNYTITNKALGLPYLMRMIRFDAQNKSERLERKINYICYIQDDCLINDSKNYFDDFVYLYQKLNESKFAFLTGFHNKIHPGYEDFKLENFKVRLSNTIDGKNFFIDFKKFLKLGNCPFYNNRFRKNGNPGPVKGSNFDLWLWRDSELKKFKNLILPDYVSVQMESKKSQNSTWKNSELDGEINLRVKEGRIYK